MIARAVPAWAAAVTGLVVGAIAAAVVTAFVKDAELASLRQRHAEQRAADDRRALARIQAATARGDQLTLDLHSVLLANADLKDQLDDQLARVTHGRPCLDPAALRVLDRAAQPTAVPAAPRGAADAGGARPAADPAQPVDGGRPEQPAASDTDVARWAAGAYARYAECAARLDALIRWHQPDTERPAP